MGRRLQPKCAPGQEYWQAQPGWLGGFQLRRSEHSQLLYLSVSMTDRTSSEPDHCIRITGIRTQLSIRRTSPALRRPGEMAPRDATNTTAPAWPTTILLFPRLSPWALRESICDSVRTSSISSTTRTSPTR